MRAKRIYISRLNAKDLHFKQSLLFRHENFFLKKREKHIKIQFTENVVYLFKTKLKTDVTP